MRRIIYVIVGCIALTLGGVGTVVPVLPTVPFLMLAAYCFGKSSRRLHHWFTNTRLYQKHLADFAAGKGMTIRTKVRIMATVTILMAIGFGAMHQVRMGQVVLGCVWGFHVLYFVFGVKTLQAADAGTEDGNLP